MVARNADCFFIKRKLKVAKTPVIQLYKPPFNFYFRKNNLI